MNDIGWAAQQLKAGKCVRRTQWQEQYIYRVDDPQHMGVSLVLVANIKNGSILFWAPRPGDIFAVDWIGYDPKAIELFDDEMAKSPSVQ